MSWVSVQKLGPLRYAWSTWS